MKDLPKKVKFPQNNNIPYEQNFGYHRGIPNNIVFDVGVDGGGSSIRLIADGYGRVEGEYGNGAIFVGRKDIKTEYIPNEDDITQQDMADFDKCMREIERFGKKVYPKLKPFVDVLFDEGIIKNNIAYRAGFDFIRKGKDVIISHPTCKEGK